MSALTCRVCGERTVNGPCFYIDGEQWGLCETHAASVIESLMDDMILDTWIQRMVENMREREQR